MAGGQIARVKQKESGQGWLWEGVCRALCAGGNSGLCLLYDDREAAGDVCWVEAGG